MSSLEILRTSRVLSICEKSIEKLNREMRDKELAI